MTGSLRPASRLKVLLAFARFMRRNLRHLVGVGQDELMRKSARSACRVFLQLLSGRPVNQITLELTSSTLDGRLDYEGGGSQVLSTLRAMDFAARHGLTYLYVPFRNIGHGDRPMEEWAAAWENLFNLGHGEARLEPGRYSLASTPPNLELVGDLGLFDLLGTERPGEIGPDTIAAARAKYYGNRSPRENDVVVVAVHVRRGDITREAYPEWWVDTEVTLRIVRQIAELLTARSLPFRITVYSLDKGLDLEPLAPYPVTHHADLDGIETLSEMIEADILVATKSGYSTVAGIYGDGIVLAPAAYDPLDGWIATDEQGDFDHDAFCRQLDAR